MTDPTPASEQAAATTDDSGEQYESEQSTNVLSEQDDVELADDQEPIADLEDDVEQEGSAE